MLTSFHLFSTPQALLQRKQALSADVFRPLQCFPWQYSGLDFNKALNFPMHNDEKNLKYLLRSRDMSSFISVVLSTHVCA